MTVIGLSVIKMDNHHQTTQQHHYQHNKVVADGGEPTKAMHQMSKHQSISTNKPPPITTTSSSNSSRNSFSVGDAANGSRQQRPPTNATPNSPTKINDGYIIYLSAMIRSQFFNK